MFFCVANVWGGGMGSADAARTPRQVFGGMVRFYRDKAGLTRGEIATRIHKSVFAL